MASLNSIRKRISSLKEVTPDQRIEFNEELTKCYDEVVEVQEMLRDLPDNFDDAPEGVNDPRMEFVEGLMANERKR